MKCSVFILLLLFLGGCTKDRIFPVPETPLTQQDTLSVITGTSGQHMILHPGDLLINEFVATGSTYPNELGSPSDWVELYNSRTDTVIMYSGYWYTTDTLGEPGKYPFPVTIKIPPHSYYVYQCDGNDSYVTQVHTNFKLSASGEQIGLYYSSDGNSFRAIDSYTFSAQTAGLSTGRIPDGSTTWNTLAPTPGTSNHQ
ncbi:MAG TPA: lamin tail domain-containing protein [Bacteroidia bacterium]|nr:lamin tail domain-containing protein [Bacteroidia bacterium]